MALVDQAAKRRRRLMWAGWGSFAVIAVVIFIILLKVVSGGGSSSTADTGSQPAPASLISQLAGISDSTFSAVGQGSAAPLPKPISAPALTQDGKPRVVYIGAEYCPYCATERWPMVVALLRFGSFKDLGVTHSSSRDAYPNTATLSFHGATYTSPYLAFTGVETQSNQPDPNGGYTQLDQLSAELQQLEKTYNAAPYVAASAAGAIPFIDFGGKYLISGSTYQPAVLQGQTADQIAAALQDPNSDIAKGAIGSANAITAALCQLTGNQPGNVCNTPVIQDLQAKLGSTQ